jgi:xanthine dehydrogenase/oxidase
MLLTLKPADVPGSPPIVDDIHITFGGMSFKIIDATATEAALRGRPWTDDIVDVAIEAIKAELTLAVDVPGGMPEYRPMLCCSFFFKFFVRVAAKMTALPANTDGGHIDGARVTGAIHAESVGKQDYDETLGEGRAPVGMPIQHTSAEKQATGEALYVDDMPAAADELEAALVMSTRAHARVLSVDPAPALAMPGVVGYFCAKDIPGSNVTGPVVQDEQVFATDTVSVWRGWVGLLVHRALVLGPWVSLHTPPVRIIMIHPLGLR